MSAETLRRLVELAKLKDQISSNPKRTQSQRRDECRTGPANFVPRKQPRHRAHTFSLDGTTDVLSSLKNSKFQNLTINPPPPSASFHVRSFSQPRTNLQFLVDTVDSVLFKQPSPSRSDYDDVFEDYLSPSRDLHPIISIHPLNLSPSPSVLSNCSPRLFDLLTPLNGPLSTSSHFPPPRLSVCSTVSESTSMLSRPSRFTKSTRSGPGDTIDSTDVYMFDEPFGQGASAQVHKGMHVPTCRLVACKRTPSLSRHTIRQLLEECRAQLEQLPDIPQVLKLLGWYRDDMTNDFVIAMEYMDLGSVFDCAFVDNETRTGNHHRSNGQDVWSSCMRRGSGHRQVFISKLSWDEIRHIAKEVVVALDAFHDRQRPLIHRDVKPQNILLSSNGDVKLADFGLLHELEGNGANHVCEDSKGTRKYFSPERIESRFNTSADIWALGITMIEIAEQRLISPNVLNDFKIGQDDYDATTLMDDLLLNREDVPSDFADFVSMCLRRDPTRRATAADLLNHSFLGSCERIDKFVDVERDAESLNTYLGWMEEWCLADEELNASMFLEGDADDLKECMRSLSFASGFDAKSIDALISEEYRRVINTV